MSSTDLTTFPIAFTKSYVDVLTRLMKIMKICQRSHLMVFNEEDNTRINLMDLNVIVHIKSDNTHANFQDEDIAITNLEFFLKFMNAIDYGAPNTSIACSNEVSTKGKTFQSFVFKGKHATYRMAVASPMVFVPKYDRKVLSDRTKDPLKLVAQFYLDKDDITRLENDIKLAGNTDLFSLMVDSGDITVFMRGLQNEQVTKTMDPLKTKVFGDYSTKSVPGEDPFRIFPSRFFKYMAYFGCDFDVEIRVHESEHTTTVAIKAYGKILNGDESPIEIVVGTQESTAAVVTNSFEIIE